MEKTPLVLLCTVMAAICIVQAVMAWLAFEETGYWLFLLFLAVSAIAAGAISLIGILVIREEP